MASRQELVEAFESKIGHSLPDDYKRFLLDGPLPRWDEEERSDNPYTDLLHSFYDLGVSEEDEWRDLESWYDNRESTKLPDWFLGIGEQYGVNIGLGLSGPYRGKVYQWSWDSLDDKEVELAASFEAFLTDIRRQEADWETRRRQAI